MGNPKSDVDVTALMRASRTGTTAIRCALSVVGASAGLSACSSVPSPASLSPMAAETSTRISAGMMRLGASPERSECYANQIASRLNEAEQAEAVRIIEASRTKEDMRTRVLAAPERVTQAFIRAHFSCSFY